MFSSSREMQLRNCLVRKAREALNCQYGESAAARAFEDEAYCVASAGASFDESKNRGWPAGMAFLTPVPNFMDIACRGAFPINCNVSAVFRFMQFARILQTSMIDACWSTEKNVL